MNAMNILTVDDVPWTVPEVPKSYIQFIDDPVALACASYRLWQESGIARWVDLESVSVTPEDRVKAEALKKYYRERLVMQALATTGTVNTSEFRKKLGQVVTNNAQLTKGDIGLLYRLPYFYQEDQDLDDIMAQTETADSNFSGTTVIDEFQLIKRVFRSRKSGDYFDYWFSRISSKTPHLMVVKQDNPLLFMWENLITKPVVLEVLAWTKHHRGYHRARMYHQIAVRGMH